MRADITRRGRHQIAILKDFPEVTGRLHRAEQSDGGFRSRIFKLEDPLQVLARQSGACAHEMLHENLARRLGVAQLKVRVDFRDWLIPAQLLLIHKTREQKRGHALGI